MPSVKPKVTKADLLRKIGELEAQSITNLKAASKDIGKAGVTLSASAVVITVYGLGGRQITPHFAICDGLSDETIKCLKEDIKRSIERLIS